MELYLFFMVFTVIHIKVESRNSGLLIIFQQMYLPVWCESTFSGFTELWTSSVYHLSLHKHSFGWVGTNSCSQIWEKWNCWNPLLSLLLLSYWLQNCQWLFSSSVSLCVWNLPGHPLLWKVCFDYRLGCGETRVLIKVEVECSRRKSQLMCVKATALTSSGICQLLSQVQNWGNLFTL